MSEVDGPGAWCDDLTEGGGGWIQRPSSAPVRNHYRGWYPRKKRSIQIIKMNNNKGSSPSPPPLPVTHSIRNVTMQQSTGTAPVRSYFYNSQDNSHNFITKQTVKKPRWRFRLKSDLFIILEVEETQRKIISDAYRVIVSMLHKARQAEGAVCNLLPGRKRAGRRLQQLSSSITIISRYCDHSLIREYYNKWTGIGSVLNIIYQSKQKKVHSRTQTDFINNDITSSEINTIDVNKRLVEDQVVLNSNENIIYPTSGTVGCCLPLDDHSEDFKTESIRTEVSIDRQTIGSLPPPAQLIEKTLQTSRRGTNKDVVSGCETPVKPTLARVPPPNHEIINTLPASTDIIHNSEAVSVDRRSQDCDSLRSQTGFTTSVILLNRLKIAHRDRLFLSQKWHWFQFPNFKVNSCDLWPEKPVQFIKLPSFCCWESIDPGIHLTRGNDCWVISIGPAVIARSRGTTSVAPQFITKWISDLGIDINITFEIII